MASRCIYGLAKDGQAPRIVTKVLDNGNPIVAVILSSLFVALGYLNATKSAATVFQYFVSLVTVFAVLNWIAILISFLSFRRAIRAQGVQLKELPYVGFLQPYGSYFALFISFTILLFNGMRLEPMGSHLTPKSIFPLLTSTIQDTMLSYHTSRQALLFSSIWALSYSAVTSCSGGFSNAHAASKPHLLIFSPEGKMRAFQKTKVETRFLGLGD